MRKMTVFRTLMQRIFFTVMLANATFLILLLAALVLTEATIDTPSRLHGVQKASALLARCQTEAEAVMIVNAIASTYEWSPEVPNLIELWTHDKRRLFIEQKQVKFAYAPLVGDPKKITPILANGQRYNLFRQDGPRWSLRIAIPQPLQPLHEYIAEYAMDPIFLFHATVSFPILILALWFAVRRGLLPLRQLSTQLAERQVDKLQPLYFDAQYGELKPVVAAIDSLLLRLRAKLALEQSFVQDAAQELHAPMAHIAAHITSLTSSQLSLEKHAIELKIDAEIARSSHLIQQLLELARQDGMRAQERQWLDVAELVRTDLAQIATRAMARQIELALEAPEHLPFALERTTFQTILQHLLDNALRYVQVGGMVAVELKLEAAHLLLRVADNGPGISAHERAAVFERFYRGTGHATSGAGLGLAIVRQAVQRLGGTVALTQGIDGGGCGFCVWIPKGA